MCLEFLSPSTVSFKWTFSLATMAYRFALVSAIAAVSAFPEIIPGPGLPSVAELGLTSVDLFTMDPIFGE